jgi:hypothetical protein
MVKRSRSALALGLLLLAGTYAARAEDQPVTIPQFPLPSIDWLAQNPIGRYLIDKYQLQTWLPFGSPADFQNIGTTLQNAFDALNQLPPPIVSVVLPEQSDTGTTYAASAAAKKGANLLSDVERNVTYLSSHLDLSAGLAGSTGLSTSIGVGAAAGVGASAGIDANLGDFLTQGFNVLRQRVWQVDLRPAGNVVVPSPITFVVGNTDQNSVTAALNPVLPVRFEKQESGAWGVTGPRGSYTGHVGIIELYAGTPLDELQLDRLTQGPVAPINVVIAGTDAQGSLAAAYVFSPSDMTRYQQVETLLNLLNTSLTRSLPVIRDHLDNWTTITNRSAHWGQGLGVAVRNRTDSVTPSVPQELKLGATVVVTADDQGLLVAIDLIAH